jgi:N-acetylglucosaminyl-diphospho-decaprenol L-rhamnosyltransferase
VSATVAADLSVVVLSWNTADLLRLCLRSLRADAPARPREVIVVDNGSHDDSPDMVAREFPGVTLIRNRENLGYAEGNNVGARAATGRFLCLLNSDTEVRPGALDRLVEFLELHPEYAAVGPRLVNPDGTVQRACMRFPGLFVGLTFDMWWARFPPGRWVDDWYYMRDFDHLHSRDVDQPPGAVFLMRREEYLAMGGLDPALFLYFNDVDLCRRLRRRGRRIRYLAEAEVVHHGGASTRRFEKMVVVWHRNRLAYYRRHFGVLGEWLVRQMVRLRARAEWRKAKERHRDDAGACAAERAFIRASLREILAR